MKQLLCNRLSELEGALLLLIFSLLSFLNGNIGAGIAFILIDVVLVSLMIWYDTIGKSKLIAMRNQYDLERVKEKFGLKEGKLVKVYFFPTNDGFVTELFLDIQDDLEIRYFAFLEGTEIGIIPMIGDKKLRGRKMKDFRTLECQFIPMTETTEEER